MKIIAVVVTYNRANLLRECIEALYRYCSNILYKIIIVNNNSTESDTIEYLNTLTDDIIKVISLKTNIGGAGGFNIGIRSAVEMGGDYVWVMDDDTIPQKNTLDKLINVLNSEENIGFLSSKVVWIDGTEHIMNKPNYVSTIDEKKSVREIKSSSFVSMLIKGSVVKEIGLPYKEFFIWGDDSEYSSRIYEKGYKGLFVSESIVLHKTAENYGPDISTAPVSTAWKFYYNTRNGLFIKRKREGIGLMFILKELNHLRLAIHNINKRKPCERSIFRKEILRGFRDGIFFNPHIEFI